MKRSLMLLALLLPFFIPGQATAQERKPNIVFIVGDDMGYADVGFHGCKDIPTPHLDALAKSGVRCTNGYVSGPYCSPTRAGLLTGRYQQRFGHEFNPGAGADIGLPVKEATLADRLKAAGYATGLVGKWHLGSAAKFQPQQRGFQEFFGFLGGAHSYFFEMKGAGILRGNEPANEKEYLTDALGREAVAFIDKHQKEPFFLYLAFNAVHTPLHASDKYLQRFSKIEDKNRRIYAAMMSAMDDAIGTVTAKLRAAGLEDNTLICFISDNGGPTMMGTTINGSNNAPLRGSKRQTLEGGIRVPFLVSWKGKLPADKVYEQPVIQLDLHASALAAAGVAVSPEWKLDGVNLLPYLDGKNAQPPHAALYWRFGNMMAIRQGDWKLVQHDNTGRHLYHLAKDIGEKDDLLTKEPEKVKELEATWKKWDAELVKPLWGAGSKAE
jgi:arylsulfatase A-like enzyme